jgi:hypothetical protein
MTCAKKQVKCTLILKDGSSITGTNDCNNPQEKCPRLPREGYSKCISICQQEGHAEDMALKQAKDKAKDAIAIIQGIDNVCKDCQRKLFEAGVREFRLIYPEREDI